MLNVNFIKMQKLTMFITASCLCFIFDQAWTWFQSPVMKKQLPMTWETWRAVTKLLYILVQGARYKKVDY